MYATILLKSNNCKTELELPKPVDDIPISWTKGYIVYFFWGYCYTLFPYCWKHLYVEDVLPACWGQVHCVYPDHTNFSLINISSDLWSRGFFTLPLQLQEKGILSCKRKGIPSTSATSSTSSEESETEIDSQNTSIGTERKLETWWRLSWRQYSAAQYFFGFYGKEHQIFV